MTLSVTHFFLRELYLYLSAFSVGRFSRWYFSQGSFNALIFSKALNQFLRAAGSMGLVPTGDWGEQDPIVGIIGLLCLCGDLRRAASFWAACNINMNFW